MSHPLIIPVNGSGRAKPNSFMYFRMCVRALVSYRHYADQLSKIEKRDPKYDSALAQVEETAVEPVIYAGMCLEATLYDLAACLFGEEFIEQIEKLDPLGKFYVVAHFVDRKPPSKASVTYQTIQAVVTARNQLIHYKSQSVIKSDIAKVISRAEKQHQQLDQGITSSFRALVLLSLYFDGNIFEELRIIPSFKKKEYWINIVPQELHEDVKWCIQASREERRRSKAQDRPSNPAFEWDCTKARSPSI